MPKKRFRLDRTQRERLISAIRKGDRPSDIARTFGVSRRTVYDYKRRVEEKPETYKTRVLTVRMPPEQLIRLDELAARIAKPRAEMARLALMQAADVFLAGDEVTAELHAVRGELNSVGVSLNQIARRLNDPYLPPNKRKLTKSEQAVLTECTGLTRQFDKLAGVVLRAAKRQATRNADLIEAMATSGNTLKAPERPAETPEAPERPAETPGKLGRSGAVRISDILAGFKGRSRRK